MHARKCSCAPSYIFSIKLKQCSFCLCLLYFESHYLLFSSHSNHISQIKSSDEASEDEIARRSCFFKTTQNKTEWKCLATTRWRNLFDFCVCLLRQSKNCLEIVLNPKSISWENCVTISQYSFSSNLFFLLLRFSWDCFRFCFSVRKIPLFWYRHFSINVTVPECLNTQAKHCTPLHFTPFQWNEEMNLRWKSCSFSHNLSLDSI